MLNISKEDLKKLNEEQNQIINSEARKIVVHAGPGSGKTYTMVQKIKKELEEIKDYQGIIACSFSREASKQLEHKIKENENNEQANNSYIGTIDSFVINEIIVPFKNRLLKSQNLPCENQEVSFYFPPYDSKSSQLEKEGIRDDNKTEIEECAGEWLNKLFNGVYEISCASYCWATYLIKTCDILSQYIAAKYTTIYIDEAQDMNAFQHMFFKNLIHQCDLKIVLIGDKNQSIYEFRGARPEQFYNLRHKGYREYEITYSVRCHKSIIDFSNLLLNPNFKYEKHDDVRVKLNKLPTADFISQLEGNYYILCKTNDKTRQVYKYLRDHQMDVILSQQIAISDKNFSDNYLGLIEDILKYKVNLKNKNPKLVVSREELKTSLSNYVIEEQIQDRFLSVGDLTDLEYIIKVFKIFKISLPPGVIGSLKEELSKEEVLNHYKNFDKPNRVMTIHASKGLEADNVFVLLEEPFKYDNAYKRELFVAFTRAKNNLYISKSKEIRKQITECDEDLNRIIKKITNPDK